MADDTNTNGARGTTTASSTNTSDTRAAAGARQAPATPQTVTAAELEEKRVSDAEKAFDDGRKRQAQIVAEQQAKEAASPPTPTQEETDRARLGLPVDVKPSGIPLDTSIHPTDAFNRAITPDQNADGTYKTR